MRIYCRSGVSKDLLQLMPNFPFNPLRGNLLMQAILKHDLFICKKMKQ